MKTQSILPASLLILLTACTSVKVVETEAEEGFQLNNYQSFTFYEEEEAQTEVLPEYRDEMEMLKEEIAEKLKARGLTQTNQAELMVNVGAVVEEKTQTRETTIMEAPRYIGQRRYSWKSEEVVTNRYKLGTVSLHLVDSDENKLVWQGVAEGIIPDNERRLQKTIEKGVEKLISEIP